MFSAERITEGLATEVIGKQVFTFDRIGSTNDHAMKQAREGAAEGRVVVADSQELGRGRFDRSWLSPPGCNLYFSILLRPQLAQAALPQMTLMAAVSLCETLRETTNLPVLIKWPNDLWIGEKKVCGILTEMTSRGSATGAVILGIGLNVNMEEERIPKALQGTATSLSCAGGRHFDRAELLQQLLRSLDRDYCLFLLKGFEPFQKRFANFSLTEGKKILSEVSGRRLSGWAIGVSLQGGLLIREENGHVQELLSGEVTIG